MNVLASIFVLCMLYTLIFCCVVLFDNILYLAMAGCSRDLSQVDSDETQPPDVPFDSSDSLLNTRRLVPGTSDLYLTYNTLVRHITIIGMTFLVCLHHVGLAIETSFASYLRR